MQKTMKAIRPSECVGRQSAATDSAADHFRRLLFLGAASSSSSTCNTMNSNQETKQRVSSVKGVLPSATTALLCRLCKARCQWQGGSQPAAAVDAVARASPHQALRRPRPGHSVGAPCPSARCALPSRGRHPAAARRLRWAAGWAVTVGGLWQSGARSQPTH